MAQTIERAIRREINSLRQGRTELELRSRTAAVEYNDALARRERVAKLLDDNTRDTLKLETFLANLDDIDD